MAHPQDRGRCAKCRRPWGDHIHPWRYAQYPNACRYVAPPWYAPHIPEQSATNERRQREDAEHLFMAKLM